MDLVHSQSFPIFSSNGQKEHLACETYSLRKAEYFRVLSRDVFGAYVEHSHDEVIAVHVSKSRDLLQLYQLAAVTEPNFIEISKLPIHNRAVLHLSADIQPDRGEFGKFLMIGGRGRQNRTYATATQLTVDPCLLSWQTRQPYLSVLCKELLSKLS